MRGRTIFAVCLVAVMLTGQASYGETDVQKPAGSSGNKIIGQSAKSFQSVKSVVSVPGKVSGPENTAVAEKPKFSRENPDTAQLSDAAGSVQGRLDMLMILNDILARMRELQEKVKRWMNRGE